MTRQDFLFKWFFYGIAIVPIWWMESFVLNRFPVMGVIPVLLPVALGVVAALEGPVGGAGFGLYIGFLCDAIYYGEHGFLTLSLCLLGWAAGALARYVLSDNMGGCLVCASGVLGSLSVFQILRGLFTQLASLPSLLMVAVPEFLWSMVFFFAIFPWIYWVKKKSYHFLRIVP